MDPEMMFEDAKFALIDAECEPDDTWHPRVGRTDTSFPITAFC